MINNPPVSAGDAGSIPGSGRSPGVGNGNPLQYFCLGNPMDRRAWQATVHGGHRESDMTEQCTCTFPGRDKFTQVNLRDGKSEKQ